VAFSVAKNGSGGKNSSDTWIVPIAGGEPTQFLPNASGLTWMNGRRLLYSEVMSGFHMGIVTSTEDRSDERAIYFPDHERAMAHFSYASPDGKWALVVEMDRTASWLPCRILPLDGSSKGHPVGPSGSCTAAGWSPDGKWMYFSSSTQGGSGPGNVGRVLGTWHLWRQRFPDGAPEQITFGPTEEEGVAVDPDGHSLVTSVGVRRSEIWLHNADGEKRLSSEGFAFEPALSADGKRAFYLLRRNSDTELWSIDLSSGKTEHLVPGATIASYEISRDGTEVAYSTGSGEASQIWLAALDRSSPPHQVTTGGGQVSFGAKGDLIFTGLNEKENYLYRIKKDGSAPRERIWSHGILEKDSVSPDGEWVIASAVLNEPGFERGPVAIPVHGGGAIRKICSYKCPSWWSPDGKFFYITTDPTPLIGRTIAIPLAPGKDLPDLPVEGIPSRGDAPKGPDIQTLRSGDLQAGDDPSTYVFTKYDFQGNLFRIPLH
jgi:Tol biopolymer transport system component